MLYEMLDSGGIIFVLGRLEIDFGKSILHERFYQNFCKNFSRTFLKRDCFRGHSEISGGFC